MDTGSTKSTSSVHVKQTRNFWKEGPPGWIYPSAITIYALAERLLGGFGYARFFDMASSGNNWLPELLLVSLGSTLGYKSVKMVNERLANQNGKYSSVETSKDP